MPLSFPRRDDRGILLALDNMISRIIGMGETVMDILFHEQEVESPNNQGTHEGAISKKYVPFSAEPGGSSFNTMISVARSGVPCHFIGYTGNNRVGREIIDFMQSNGLSTDYFQIRGGEKTAISLAYLDENGDADYTFYKDEPLDAEPCATPDFTAEDYLLYGSYFSISKGLRRLVTNTLYKAHDANTVIYYDINFRRSHQHQLNDLLPNIQENCRLSSIVRGSADDFEILFGTRDAQEIYDKHISPLCPVFICTSGAGHIYLCTPSATYDFDVPQIPSSEIVSTVGAGDNFNAGFLCAMRQRSIRKSDLENLPFSTWQELVAEGIRYSAQVCRSRFTYIDAKE